MRITLTIDDALLEEALALADSGIEKPELIQECVKAFIRQQVSRRLAALGGQSPDMALAPRRRPEPDAS